MLLANFQFFPRNHAQDQHRYMSVLYLRLSLAAAVVIVGLAAVLSTAEAVPPSLPITTPEPTCDYPWKFYPDGSEPPPEACCFACHCKCRTSKPHPLGDLAGGKCWARCGGCEFEVCEAIWFDLHFSYRLKWHSQVKTVKYIYKFVLTFVPLYSLIHNKTVQRQKNILCLHCYERLYCHFSTLTDSHSIRVWVIDNYPHAHTV